MDLPVGKYAILGSGPLAVRGLREGRDLDLIVIPEVYEDYKRKEEWIVRVAYGREFLANNGIEIWKDIGPGEWNIEELIQRAEIIDGFPFVNLIDFIRWKEQAGREKDLKDVALARQFLERSG
jgi:hypothetical protein